MLRQAPSLACTAAALLPYGLASAQDTAIRSLADESRCLSLMSRYESRLQRVHDKAYTALRELQQSRTAQPPPLVPHNPSVSEGEVSTNTPGEIPIENKKSRNESTAPSPSSPDIHLCPPIPPAESGNWEDHEG